MNIFEYEIEGGVESLRMKNPLNPISRELQVAFFSVIFASICLFLIWHLNDGKIALRDDAYIHMVYARNLVMCKTWGFNCGEYSAGESSPFFMLFYIPLFIFFGEIPSRVTIIIYAWILNLILLFLTSIMAYRLTLHIFRDKNLATYSTLLLTTNLGIIYGLAEGMENILSVLLVVSFVYYFLNNDYKMTSIN